MAGISVGAVALTAHDPSSPSFCEVISGSALAHRAPPTLGACKALEITGAFDSQQCATDFCAAGVGGLAVFLGGFLGWLHGSLERLGWVMLGLGAVQLAQLTLTAVMVCRGFSGEHARADGAHADDRTTPPPERPPPCFRSLQPRLTE